MTRAALALWSIILPGGAGLACGAEAIDGAPVGGGATLGVGAAGASGIGGGAGRSGRGGQGGNGGRGGRGASGAPGRGGSTAAVGGQIGRGGSFSQGGEGGAAGSSMGGAGAVVPTEGTCSSPRLLGPDTAEFRGRVERMGANNFDICAGEGPEEVLRWTPPGPGRYVIDTFGSAFDTVLYVSTELRCNVVGAAPERECNDDFYRVQSLLPVESALGQDMFIVVDSYNSTGGEYVLRVRDEPACPHLDLGREVGAALFRAPEPTALPVLAPPDEDSLCSRGDVGLTILWEAPAAGTYRFDTAGSTAPSVIGLRDGCQGTFMGCDDDGMSEPGSSDVTSVMEQGQEVVIELGAFAAESRLVLGSLVLNVTAL